MSSSALRNKKKHPEETLLAFERTTQSRTICQLCHCTTAVGFEDTGPYHLCLPCKNKFLYEKESPLHVYGRIEFKEEHPQELYSELGQAKKDGLNDGSVKPKQKLNSPSAGEKMFHSEMTENRSSFECPFLCGEDIRKEDLIHHLKDDCPNRHESCTHCHVTFLGSSKEDHYKECDVLNRPPEEIVELPSKDQEVDSELKTAPDKNCDVENCEEQDSVNSEKEEEDITVCPLCKLDCPTDSVIHHMKMTCRLRRATAPEERKDNTVQLSLQLTKVQKELQHMREECQALMISHAQEVQELQTKVQYLMEENKTLKHLRLKFLQVNEKESEVGEIIDEEQEAPGPEEAEDEDYKSTEEELPEVSHESSSFLNSITSYEEDRKLTLQEFLVTEYAKDTEVSLMLLHYSRVKELSSVRPEEYIKKAFLIAHRHHFKVRIYPCGYGSYKGTHLSVILRLLPDAHKKPIRWNFRNRIYFVVKNSRSSCDDLCEQVRPPPDQDSLDSATSFLEVGSLHLSHEQLEDETCGFIENNTMNVVLHFYMRYEDEEIPLA